VRGVTAAEMARSARSTIDELSGKESWCPCGRESVRHTGRLLEGSSLSTILVKQDEISPTCIRRFARHVAQLVTRQMMDDH
jgi:hypothetical protein